MNTIENFEKSRDRVSKAHDEILRRLFGFIPCNPTEYRVSRKEYTKVMKAVQKETGLKEGDPDMVLFVLEQLSRSPQFIEEE